MVPNPTLTDTGQAAKTKSDAARPVVKSLATKKEAEVKWDTIDLSDDEDWEKVASDEGAEWEVLEK